MQEAILNRELHDLLMTFMKRTIESGFSSHCRKIRNYYNNEDNLSEPNTGLLTCLMPFWEPCGLLKRKRFRTASATRGPTGFPVGPTSQLR
jgi:hypothetical protein